MSPVWHGPVNTHSFILGRGLGSARSLRRPRVWVCLTLLRALPPSLLIQQWRSRDFQIDFLHFESNGTLAIREEICCGGLKAFAWGWSGKTVVFC